MSAHALTFSEEPQHSRIVNLALRACDGAAQTVRQAGAGLIRHEDDIFAEIDKGEEELDRIDREMDEAVVFAITETTVSEARELLTCLKFVIDLERIGDLVSGFASRSKAVGRRISSGDTQELLQMLTILETMLVKAKQAFLSRDLNLALAVLKADSEIDRMRNLIFIRHIELRDPLTSQESVQVLFMAHALERAGDHAKNLAEEVCHYVSGRTVRHLMRELDKSYEQMFIEWLKEKHLD
jgi:phosphate transport system protein